MGTSDQRGQILMEFLFIVLTLTGVYLCALRFMEITEQKRERSSITETRRS